ncbi:hypothetical protein DMENIID0001_143140 [Sergentomyia squamirostris]
MKLHPECHYQSKALWKHRVATIILLGVTSSSVTQSTRKRVKIDQLGGDTLAIGAPPLELQIRSESMSSSLSRICIFLPGIFSQDPSCLCHPTPE